MEVLDSKKTILDLVKERVVILDGAMGSQLLAAGLQPGTPSEKWNVEHPEIIQRIQKSYFDAGSDVVLTNTFGGTRIKLEAFNQGDKVEEYNSVAVENAHSICPERGLIAGDIGPTGLFLPPVGKATIDDFYENFLEQAKILAENKVDLFFIETMMDIQEAAAAVKAAKKATNIPIIASITFQKTKRGFFTVMGNSIVDCANILSNLGVDVIGANCTITSEEMIDLVPELRKVTSLPISVKPNAGKPELKNGSTFYPTTSEGFSKDIQKMIINGANIVGGCCGTDQSFIEKIFEIVQIK